MKIKNVISIDRNILKIIAIIAMTVNHIGYSFNLEKNHYRLYNMTVFIGFLTFPIMAYMLTEGFAYTKSRKKYAIRLFLFAIISILPFHFVFDMPRGETINLLNNVFFTLFFGLISLIFYEKINSEIKDKTKRFLIRFVGICVLYYLSQWSDWGMYGIPLILLFYIFRDSKYKIILPLISLFICVSFVMWSNYFFTRGLVTIERPLTSVGILLAMLLLQLYNGEKKVNEGIWKYFFYLYYPLHLMIIFIVNF